MKETLYEEDNNNSNDNIIELQYMDRNLTINPLNNKDNSNEKNHSEIIKGEDKQELHKQKKWNLYNQSSILNIIPQKQIRAYAFDVFKFFSQQYRKYFSLCKTWSIMAQVLFIYFILMFIFLLVVIATRASQIQSLLDTQSNKNYYTSIVKEMIDAQREVKVELDKLNNNIRMKNINEPILFMQIYTNELIKHKILEGNTTDNTTPFVFLGDQDTGDNSRLYYNNISEGFTLSNTLKNLVQLSDKGNENYRHLIPFYYHFTPVLYLRLLRGGFHFVSMYFVAFPQSKETKEVSSCELCSLLYFKYPDEVSRTVIEPHSNSEPLDSFIDPVHKCFEPKAKSSFSKIMKANNWFYKLNLIKNKAISGMIKQEHINPETMIKEEYLLYYQAITMSQSSSCSSLTPPNDKYTMLFAMRLKEIDMTRKYIKLNKEDDTLNFDYLSLFNFPRTQSIQTQSDQNDYDGLFKGYDSDESDSMVFDIPKFVTNMYLYTINSQNNNRINSIIKYSKMDKLFENEKNHFFKHDTNYFHLLVFLNDYLSYHNERKELSALVNHPYLSFNYLQYYKGIQESKIDCLNDYCYFNACDSSSPLNVDPLYSQYMPNCYCLPLYSKDSSHLAKDDIPTFHSKIKEAYPYQSDDFYAYDDPKKESPTSYFDYKGKKEFSCRLNIKRKSSKKITSFNSKISLQTVSSHDNATMMLMFLLNNGDIDENVKEKYDQYISDIIWILYLIYGIFLCIMIVMLTWFMYRNVLKLTSKMKKFEEYRKNIIPIADCSSNNNNQKLSTDSNNNNNSNEEESSQLINSKALAFLKKMMSLFDIKEEDELDKLMNLISNNIDHFKIDFSINGTVNANIREIQKQYHEMNKINDYKSQFFIQRANKAKRNKIIVAKGRKESLELQLTQKIDSKENEENYSLNLLYEMLSMSDKHLLDFDSLKPNFYHIDDTLKTFINFSALDEKIIDDKEEIDERYSNEINNIKKIDNGIKYYIKNIHSYWKQRYNLIKTEEKKSPQGNYI